MTAINIYGLLNNRTVYCFIWVDSSCNIRQYSIFNPEYLSKEIRHYDKNYTYSHSIFTYTVYTTKIRANPTTVDFQWPRANGFYVRNGAKARRQREINRQFRWKKEGRIIVIQQHVWAKREKHVRPSPIYTLSLFLSESSLRTRKHANLARTTRAARHVGDADAGTREKKRSLNGRRWNLTEIARVLWE